MTLSASKIQTLGRCGREYLYKYVLKEQEPVTSDALVFGKAFHQVLEGTDVESVPLEGLDETKYPYRAALRVMRDTYLQATEFMPKVIKHEYKIETVVPVDTMRSLISEDIVGYVDAIRLNEATGEWYITERKTASLIDQNRREMLPSDLQLAVYVTSAPLIARDLGLQENNFSGVYYEIVKKPSERLRSSESLDDFSKRLTSETVIWHLDTNDLAKLSGVFKNSTRYAVIQRETIENLYYRSGNDIESVPRNTSQCQRFGNKCGYWSKCYGGSDSSSG